MSVNIVSERDPFRNYSHLVEIEESSRLLKIYRALADGSKDFLTQLALPPTADTSAPEYAEFARRLAECFLFDSPAARRVLDASPLQETETCKMPSNQDTCDTIASRRFRARAADGKEFEIELGVGRPIKCTDVDWRCGVTLKGLYNRLADARGGDSWQALMLAQGLAQQLLTAFVEDGGELMDMEDGLAVKVENVFSRGTH